MKTFLLVITCAISTAIVAGCSDSHASLGSSKGADTTCDSDCEALQSAVVGVWHDSHYFVDGAQFETITIGADGTYSWSAPATFTMRPGGNSLPADSGTWIIGLSGPQLGAPQGAYLLELTDQSGQENSFFVSVSSGNLVLALTFGNIPINGQAGFAYNPVSSADAGDDSDDAATDTSDAACNSASDCTGVTTAACSSGTPGWTCSEGQCEPSCN